MTINEKYADMRIGQSFMFPVLSMINFVIISYSLTPISEYLDIMIYIPMMMGVVLLMLVVVGKFMRKFQQPTDLRLAYERDKENAKNQIIIHKALQRTFLPEDPMYQQLQKRIDYHKEILEK